MSAYLENPGWDLNVTLEGTCRHCGADLSGAVRVRATTEWVTRYYHDAAFQRLINQAIERKAIARHARVCRGERVEAQRQPAWAATA